MVDQKPLVLVTGASGFISTHILTGLLARGYRVRGTARSEKSAEGIRKVHQKYAPQLEVVILDNIEKLDAWPPELFDGVEVFLHTAAAIPLGNASNLEEEIMNPGIDGTMNALRAVAKHGPSVRRLVYTSSFAAVSNLDKGPDWDHVYSESDWCPWTYEHGATSGDDIVAYITSKGLAERAAWDFVEQEKPHFEFVTLLPPAVFGELTQPNTTIENIRTHALWIYEHMNGSLDAPKHSPFRTFANVTDVAYAHIAALERPQAAGKRYLLSAGAYQYTDICAIIRQEYPDLINRVPDPAKMPRERSYVLDSSLSVSDLGVEYKGLRQTIREMVDSLLALEQA